jgi:hypothetical protein
MAEARSRSRWIGRLALRLTSGRRGASGAGQGRARLKVGLLAALLLVYVALTGCGGGSNPPPPTKPSLSQTVSLVNDVDIKYTATLTNLNGATRTITHDGIRMYDTTITYSPYNETLEDRAKGVWGFELKSGNLSDTDSVTVPNYEPTFDSSGLETNLNQRYEGSSLDVCVDERLKDKNKEDEPVSLNDVTSLSGAMTVTRTSGYCSTIKSNGDIVGDSQDWQVQFDYGSDQGGRGTSILSGRVIAVPEQITFPIESRALVSFILEPLLMIT